MPAKGRSPTWVFDALPPSGARRGGDPAEHAFKHNLDTFVREVVQNANDQRLTGAAAQVHFRFHELRGADLHGFQSELAWPELEAHLRGAAGAGTRGGRAISRFLDELGHTQRLRLLEIEDRNTVGLTGDEFEEDTHFRALCKDTLYSHKRLDAAGGSFGLGKSVLWAFSGLSTVLFNSVLETDPPAHRSPRMIGRVELPSHRVGTQWFSGSGWFGRPVGSGPAQYAESLWHLDAGLQARLLHLGREERSTGTSILIVGFGDPTVDEEAPVASLSEQIRKEATRYFWPAMVMSTPGLRITTDGVLADPETAENIRPFVDCWRARASRRSTLDEAGDVVVRSIPVELPPERHGTNGVRGQVLLAVRLASEKEPQDLAGRVAWFRGPGMVVSYWGRSGLAQGMRPFHAVLACGTARAPGNEDPSDAVVERFLRDAEPPGHDDWFATPALKENWKRGYAKALEQLKDRVNQELRDLLAPKPAHGSRGPEKLQKRFPMGTRGKTEAEPSAFRFSDLSAIFDGDRWSFSGTVGPSRRTARSWEVGVSLQELGDGGAVLGELQIDRIEVGTAGAQVLLDSGSARIAARAGLAEVTFSGISAAHRAGAAVGELALRVTSRLDPGSKP